VCFVCSKQKVKWIVVLDADLFVNPKKPFYQLSLVSFLRFTLGYKYIVSISHSEC